MRIQFLLLYFTITISAFAPENSNHLIQVEEQRETRIEQEKIEQEKKKRITNLLTALRIIESNNNYNARGASGEYGAYQFMPKTWDFYCKMLVGETLDITVPENQDKIARLKIEIFINEGYSNADIAATWNSGSRDNWQTKIGVNVHGVIYNVPAYVNYFSKTLNQLT